MWKEPELRVKGRGCWLGRGPHISEPGLDPADLPELLRVWGLGQGPQALGSAACTTGLQAAQQRMAGWLLPLPGERDFQRLPW